MQIPHTGNAATPLVAQETGWQSVNGWTVQGATRAVASDDLAHQASRTVRTRLRGWRSGSPIGPGQEIFYKRRAAIVPLYAFTIQVIHRRKFRLGERSATIRGAALSRGNDTVGRGLWPVARDPRGR